MKKKFFALLAVAVVFGTIFTSMPKADQMASDVPPDPLVISNSF